MVLSFDRAHLEPLDKLQPELRGAFAAACAERLMPRYRKFSELAQEGDPDSLERSLSRLWADLLGRRMPDAELEAMLRTCMKLISQLQSDSDWPTEQAEAEDAASALAYALRCRRNGQSEEVGAAAKRAYEAVDCYVIKHGEIDTNAPGAEAEILSHPLIQVELGRQKRDLDELLNGRIDIAGLRGRAKAEAATFLL
ncbi:MAG: DUF416 family protein [Planctomycetota bacterium]